MDDFKKQSFKVHVSLNSSMKTVQKSLFNRFQKKRFLQLRNVYDK